MDELLSNIETKLNNYDKFINDIQNNFSNLEVKINNLENKIKIVISKKDIEEENIEDENIIELKKEIIDIPLEIVEKSLVYKDYRSVIFLFKYFYKNKTNDNYKYPIRIKSKRVYEYYNNKQWISDNNAHYIKFTLFLNIQTLLYKYNNIDNVKDVDDIYNNQIFINKLSDDKYKRDVFKHIIDEIKN